MNTDKIYAESIAKEYAMQDTSKLTALKKLDRKAKRTANVFTYCFGVVMTLILGVGMCFAMGTLGSGDLTAKIVGIVVGAIGIVGVSVNYPIYKKLLADGKKKYGFEIMTLAREITEAVV